MTVRVPIEAVFFDFGGVFIDSPFAMVGTAAERLGVDEAHLVEVIFGPYDTDTDHPWHRVERGELAFEAARSEISAIAATGCAMPMLCCSPDFTNPDPDARKRARDHEAEMIRVTRAYESMANLARNQDDLRRDAIQRLGSANP